MFLQKQTNKKTKIIRLKLISNSELNRFVVHVLNNTNVKRNCIHNFFNFLSTFSFFLPYLLPGLPPSVHLPRFLSSYLLFPSSVFSYFFLSFPLMLSAFSFFVCHFLSIHLPFILLLSISLFHGSCLLFICQSLLLSFLLPCLSPSVHLFF